MKRKGAGKKGYYFFTGAALFFCLIALIIQIAVLVYDYIISKTQNKGLIALLMLGVIVILSAFCSVADAIRRKKMIYAPLERILYATERISSGDFTVRLVPRHAYGKYDEFDLIMENLNVMAAELSKSEILKSDFVSNVSHELKTPLFVIRNYAALLSSERLSEEERVSHAKTLVAVSGRLSSLVSNILQLNKLENSKIKTEYTLCDLTALLSEAALGFEELVEEKRLTLDCDLDEVKIVSSPALLELVFNNLLSNAVKFTNEGGRVALKLKREGENAVVEIEDNGCGISPEVGARIFEKFYQGDTSHQAEGNGLGLALVKKVIDVLGGKISVKSEMGKGSTFTVTLRNCA